MLLPAVTKYSIPATVERYAHCAKAMAIVSEETDEQAACDALLSWLEDLNEELLVPSAAEFGINKHEFMDKLDIMAEQALASGSPGNNPRVPSEQEMKSIYQELWS